MYTAAYVHVDPSDPRSVVAEINNYVSPPLSCSCRIGCVLFCSVLVYLVPCIIYLCLCYFLIFFILLGFVFLFCGGEA